MKLGLVVLVALLVAAPASAADNRAEAAAVGRVAFTDAYEGIVIADFPSGRRIVSMDPREVQQYIPGDAIRIDSFGRPLPRVVGR